MGTGSLGSGYNVVKRVLMRVATWLGCAAMTDLPLDPALAQTRGVTDRLGDKVLVTLVVPCRADRARRARRDRLRGLRQSGAAFSAFGLGFVSHTGWDVGHGVYGARDFIYGSLVTGLGALLFGTPLAIAIALYLNELAPRQLRTTITALVELLAAIPSVVLGLFGIIVLGPFVKDYLDPALSSVLGFIPFFHKVDNVNGSSIMTAVVVLTIMVVPIIASGRSRCSGPFRATSRRARSRSARRAGR